MNLRKIASLCALSVAAPLMAGVTGSNQTGLLMVTSTATNTIVSVPWLDTGSGTAIKVADIVRTTDLTAGDMVLSADDKGAYSCWVLNSDKTAWEAAQVASAANKGFSAGEHAGTAALERGKGIWLIRQNPTSGGVAVPFYLYGQYSATAISTTITAGSTTKPVYHLLGNPKTVNTALPLTGMTPAAADTVVVPKGNNNLVYKYDETAKKFQRTYYAMEKVGEDTKRVKHTDELGSIPAGTGFWYVSRGGSGTIAW